MKEARVLTLNLSNRSYDYRLAPLSLLGGRGFAAEYYAGLKDKKALIIALAPFSQHPHKAAGRYTIGYQSPLYNEYRSSTVRGAFGGAISSLGLDVVVIQGALQDHGVVGIKKDGAEFSPPDSRGENQTPFLKAPPSGAQLSPVATVCDETGRQFGQGGLGAVLGAKKIVRLEVLPNDLIEISPLPPEVACDHCGKQWGCNRPKKDSVANKYGIDSHMLRVLAKLHQSTQEADLDKLAAELASGTPEMIRVIREQGLGAGGQRPESDKMVLGDCLGLCGFGLNHYTIKSEEKELILKVLLLEQSLKQKRPY